LKEAHKPEPLTGLNQSLEKEIVKPTTNFSQTPTLVQSEISRDRLASEAVKTTSHELRTPLNVIIGICQLLLRDRKTPLTPLHRDAVDRMERNARALLRSVNQLIDQLRTNGNGHH